MQIYKIFLNFSFLLPTQVKGPTGALAALLCLFPPFSIIRVNGSVKSPQSPDFWALRAFDFRLFPLGKFKYMGVYFG